VSGAEPEAPSRAGRGRKLPLVEAVRTSLDTFDLGDVALQSGELLRDARLVYATFGLPNARRDNAVLLPTFYAGTHRDNACLVGPGRALDPSRWFVVVPNLFGNGVSSSPSHRGPQHGADFPRVTIHDNVVCQQRLLEERLGVEHLALAVGWSMGAQQAYQFAALFPDRVRALLAVCGSAKTSLHNWVFLEGVKAALLADPDFNGGRYERPPRRGLDAFGRVYAGWAYSQAFFRRGLHEELGFATAAHLLDAWAREHRGWDANDLLAMLWTWQHADLSANDAYRGDVARALAAIEARAIVMPCRTDLYFPPEDSALEVARMKHAELRSIDSDWGHIAGGPDRSPVDTAFVERAIRELLP
jgi:homoserine O-acetyltransferase/O-succinyltransferase